MTTFEKIMAKLEKHIIKIVTVIKYFSVLCMGAGITMIIEYGFNLDFILLVVLSTILFCCTAIKIKEDREIAE